MHWARPTRPLWTLRDPSTGSSSRDPEQRRGHGMAQPGPRPAIACLCRPTGPADRHLRADLRGPWAAGRSAPACNGATATDGRPRCRQRTSRTCDSASDNRHGARRSPRSRGSGPSAGGHLALAYSSISSKAPRTISPAKPGRWIDAAIQAGPHAAQLRRLSSRARPRLGQPVADQQSRGRLLPCRVPEPAVDARRRRRLRRSGVGRGRFHDLRHGLWPLPGVQPSRHGWRHERPARRDRRLVHLRFRRQCEPLGHRPGAGGIRH